MRLSTQPNHDRWAEQFEIGPPMIGCGQPEMHPTEMRERIKELEKEVENLEYLLGTPEEKPISAPDRPYWGGP